MLDALKSQELQVDKEFRTLIPPLTDEEYSELEQNLLDNGCRDKLVVWSADINSSMVYILVDGHNRYEICKRHGIDFTVHTIEFPSREEAKIWVIKNQFARRNLDTVQRSRLALTMKSLFAELAKENQGKRTDLDNSNTNFLLESTKSYNPINTREELAKIAGVSQDMIRKVEIVDSNAPEPIKQAMEKKDVSINKAYKATKALNSMPEPEREEIAKSIDKAYEKFAGDEEAATQAVVEIIKTLPQEQKQFALNAADDAFAKHDPVCKEILKQRDLQQAILGMIQKTFASIPESPEELEAWLSDMSLETMQDQLYLVSKIIDSYLAMKSFVEKRITEKTQIRRV